MDMDINSFIIGEEYIIIYCPIYRDMIKEIIYRSKCEKTREYAIKEINNNESNICNFIKYCESYKCVLNEIIIDNNKYFKLIFKIIKKMNNNSTTIRYINKELIEINGYLKDNIINNNLDIIISFKKYDKIYKEKLIEDNLNKNYNKTMAKLLYNIYDKLEIDIIDILKDS